MNHSACRKGKRVKIKLRDGGIITDKFIERKGGTIFLEKYGRLSKNKIRMFVIIKSTDRG